MQLGELQDKISEIEKLNGKVIAFATLGNKHDVESTKSVYKITYTLVPTPNRKVVEKFGVVDESYGFIIIDKKGRVRYKDISLGGMQHSVTEIIRELGGMT